MHTLDVWCTSVNSHCLLGKCYDGFAVITTCQVCVSSCVKVPEEVVNSLHLCQALQGPWSLDSFSAAAHQSTPPLPSKHPLQTCSERSLGELLWSRATKTLGSLNLAIAGKVRRAFAHFCLSNPTSREHGARAERAA